jgi:hypothetical protein
MCKAILEQGANKGKTCDRPPQDNGYCGKHQKQALKEENKDRKKCTTHRCNIFISAETTEKYCKSCLEKKANKRAKLNICKAVIQQGEGKGVLCTYEALKDIPYCGKHQRQVYYDEEKEKGIRYCDIDRGCFTIVETGKHKCEKCLESNRMYEKCIFYERKTLHKATAEDTTTEKTICVDCGKDYEKWETDMNGKPLSMRCRGCNLHQQIADKNRGERGRNYKNENLRNPQRYFAEYVRGAAKRAYDMMLTYEQFHELIMKPCYYCDHKVEDEVNGIDRYDNTKGYTVENCVPCCEMCNIMKLDKTVDEFLERCSRIVSNKEKIFTRPAP